MKLYDSIVQNCRHFDHFNSLKFSRFQQLIISANVKKIVNSVPALLCTNNSKVPGYVSGSVKFGVYNYMPDAETQRYFKGRFGVEISPPPGNPMVETLAVMGSVGTIAYNKKSDFDYWAVVDRNYATEEEYLNFRKKVEAIQKWAMKEAGVEVHIFINDVTKLRNNIFDEDEDEGFGSTIGAVLKDEFFRASIIVSGKIPFWWVVPKFLPDNDYAKLYKSVSTTEIGARLVDIGNLFKISKDDFMGASLFQLIKAIGNPFKSILKIGILEKYLFGDNSSGLLSQKLKMSMLRGQLSNSVPDSYLMMFNEVYKYYGEVLEDRALLNVLRQNLYLKIDPQLSKYVGLRDSQKLPYKVAVMFKVVADWGWKMNQVRDLDNFESWDYNRIIQFWNYVKKFMLLSYQKISREIPNMNLQSKISDTDFQLLRSKIKANFSMEPDKIENFITFKDTPNEPYLYIEPDQSTIKGGHWRVFKKLRQGKGGEVEVNIKNEANLVSLLAWCSINQIYEPTFSRLYFESGYYHYNKNHIVELLNEIFEMFNSKKAHLKNEFYLKPARTYKNMIIMNFGESDSSEIVTFSHLFMNSWGESFLRTYSNPSDMIMIFSKVIKDSVFLARDFDEFCYFNSPEPHKKLYKQVEKVFRRAFEYLKNGKDYIVQSFVTAFGEDMVYIRKSGSDVKVMSLGNFFELLGNLSLESGNYHEIKVFSEENQNLMILEEILSRRNSKGVSFVYEEKPKYVVIYLLDSNGNLFTFIKKKIHDDLPVAMYKFCKNIVRNYFEDAVQGEPEDYITCHELEFDRFRKFSFRETTKKVLQFDYLNSNIPGSVDVEVYNSKGQLYYILKRGDVAVGPVPLSGLKDSLSKLGTLDSSVFEVIDVSFKGNGVEGGKHSYTDYFKEKYRIEKLFGATI